MAARPSVGGRRRRLREGLPSAALQPGPGGRGGGQGVQPAGPDRSSTSSCCTATIRASGVDEFADALLEQVDAGRIGGFGVSNWTVSRLRELRTYLDGNDAGHLLAFSNHFSLAEMVSAPWEGCLAVSRGELDELARPGREGARVVEPRHRVLRGTRRHRTGTARRTARGASGRPSSASAWAAPRPRSRSPTCCTSPATCCRSCAPAPRRTWTRCSRLRISGSATRSWRGWRRGKADP